MTATPVERAPTPKPTHSRPPQCEPASQHLAISRLRAASALRIAGPSLGGDSTDRIPYCVTHLVVLMRAGRFPKARSELRDLAFSMAGAAPGGRPKFLTKAVTIASTSRPMIKAPTAPARRPASDRPPRTLPPAQRLSSVLLLPQLPDVCYERLNLLGRKLLAESRHETLAV